MSTDSGVEGDDGSVVLAVDGALPDGDEVQVVLEATPLPGDSADLSVDVKALGKAFELSSDRPVSASPDTPFLIALPIPEGADRDHLGIAVLDSDTMYAPPEGDDVTGLGREWVYLDAVVEEDSDLVIAPLLSLSPEPIVAVVVEAQAFNSRQTSARSTVSGAIFEGTCGPGFSSAIETCTTTDRSTAAAMLEDSYNTLTLLGFTDEPQLQRGIGTIKITYLGGLNWDISFVPGAYQIQLRPSSGENASGMYSSSTGRIWLAIGTNGVTESQRDTVRHEYIHATQFADFDGFPSTSAFLRSRWVIEGQAVVSQKSFTNLQRDGRSPRVVDTTLERSRWTGSSWRAAPSSEYQAQDFWWYLIQRFDADISLLRPFIERGLDVSDVNSTLWAQFKNDFGGSGPFGGLPLAYWDWVKNQVFEKGVDMGDAAFGDTCEFTTGAATPQEINYVVNGENNIINEPIPSLTAYVVHLKVPAGEGWRDTLQVKSSSNYVRSTIYSVPANGGTQGCIGQADSDTRTITAGDESQEFYVVVANTSMNNDYAISIEFDGTAGIDIVTPADGSSLDEGEITVRAELAGFETATDVRWTYRRPADGLLWTFLERTQSGESKSWTLCDGDYEITAEAMQGSDIVATSSIDISLQDLGDTNPPDDCRPTVSIQEPIESKGYLAGDPVDLKADIQNTGSAVQGPRYDVEWRIGNPNGTVIATGTGTSATFGDGLVELYVSYGVATDSVTFNSVTATNDPPSATITSPEDGKIYFMGDDEFGEGGNGYTITVTGTGSSPQEGALTGESLTWETRSTDGGGGNWGHVGTGTSVDIFYHWYGCSFQNFEVRLTATDSQELSASDTISIRTQPPVC